LGDGLAPIAAVEYLEAALAFASNHGLSMAIAQLDLANRTAGCINLPDPCRFLNYLVSLLGGFAEQMFE